MTPHCDAALDEIAKIVIMPGDPERAKLIADNYLEDVKLVSNVRGMNVFTGNYKGVRVTVMPSGMGIPSMGIYSYELFKVYGVEKIIKVGTCGSYTKDLNLGDLVLVNASYSESMYAKMQDSTESELIYASDYLNFYLKESAEKLGKHVTISNIHCTDLFYEEDGNCREVAQEKYFCMACEMESYSLFYNAKKFGKKASEILTVTDNIITKEKMSSSARRDNVMDMIEVALESVLEI